MNKNRLEAFSDGVLAIIITIMVLDLRTPAEGTWAALQPLLPAFLSYALEASSSSVSTGATITTSSRRWSG